MPSEIQGPQSSVQEEDNRTIQVAQVLREEMHRMDVSPDYLAEYTGLDQAHVRRIISGESEPTVSILLLFAMALVSDGDKLSANPSAAAILSRLLAAALHDAAELTPGL